MRTNGVTGQIILYALAAACVIFEIYLIISTALFCAHSEKTTAVVTVEEGYIMPSVYVDYEFDGQTYEHVFASAIRFGKKTGDAITIECKKSDPRKIKWNYQYAADLIFFGFLTLTSVGLCVFDLAKKKNRKEQISALLSGGKKITADVIGVATDFSIRRRGGYPYGNLECLSVDENGAPRYFISERIAGRLDKKNTYSIDVYVDENNKDVYYVDVDSLRVSGKKDQSGEAEE